MNLSNMKVGMRLALGFALVLVLMVVLTVVGIVRTGQIQSRLDHVIGVSNVVTRLVVDMRNNVSERVTSLRTLTLMTDPADMEPELKRFKEQTAKYDALQAKLSEKFALEASAEEKALLAQIKEAEGVAMPAIEKASQLYLANNAMDATRVMVKEIRPAQKKWLEALDQLAEREDKQNAQTQLDAGAQYESARNIMLITLLVAVAIGVAAAYVITRGLLKQLGGEPGYTSKIATSIAEGDLSIAIDTKSSDRGSLLSEMKQMRNSLVDIVSQVRRGTHTITTASREIAAGNTDLSSRTELQASSLEKTASAMEELTSTVKQNAENAREANQLAATASDVARKGGEVVSQVIDGIAFQTNILALNAAVEAARAGEQGRGFAVVASEVRNLAQRSAAAAKEIKTLIGDSVEKIGRGSKLVGQAGVTMDEVVGSVKRVTDIMSEIANASAEQSAGIEQVNLSIIEMDGMTQQNAALVEQAAAAFQSLQDQAAELQRVVSIFKLEGEEAAAESAISTAVATRAVVASPARSQAARRPAASPQLKKPAPAARKAATAKADDAAPEAGSASSTSKKVAAAAASDDWEEF